MPAPHIRRLFQTLFIPELLYTVGWGLILPVLPRLATSLSGSVAGAAGIVALVAVGTLVADIPAGVLAARWPQRTLTLAVLGALAVAGLLAAFGGSVLLLGAAALLLGAGRGTWMVTRMAVARETVPAHQRGRALATLGGMNRIGSFAVGPAVGGAVAELLGLWAPFAALSCLMILAGAAVLRWTPRRPPPAPARAGGWYHPVAIVRDHWPMLLRAGPAIIALNLIRAGRQLFIPLWGESIGLSVAEVGLAMSASGIADMLLFYPTGVVMDRLGRRWAAASSIAVMSLSLALMPLTGSFLSLLLIGILAGAGNGLGSGFLMTMGTDLAPKRGAGEFIGLWRLIGDVGTAGGPALIGAVAGILSLAVAGPVVGLFGFTGAALFIFSVKETLRRR
ncbi:MAG: MFS transporter [Spirochaetaceae bacterium]|nr:MFS transporter [Spirochaetaceae bacterium]